MFYIKHRHVAVAWFHTSWIAANISDRFNDSNRLRVHYWLFFSVGETTEPIRALQTGLGTRTPSSCAWARKPQKRWPAALTDHANMFRFCLRVDSFWECGKHLMSRTLYFILFTLSLWLQVKNLLLDAVSREAPYGPLQNMLYTHLLLKRQGWKIPDELELLFSLLF